MKKYTHNNSSVALKNESRVYLADAYGQACYPIPFALMNNVISPYPLRPNEDLGFVLIKDIEQAGHLVLSSSEAKHLHSNPVRDMGELSVTLSVKKEDEADSRYAYIGLPAYAAEVYPYPMFETEAEANSEIKIAGDLGDKTLCQLADLAKFKGIEILSIHADAEDDNFFADKMILSGRQSDEDRIGDTTIRFDQNDQYTENTKNRILKLGATTGKVVVLDGFHYLKVKVTKNPVQLTIKYQVLK